MSRYNYKFYWYMIGVCLLQTLLRDMDVQKSRIQIMERMFEMDGYEHGYVYDTQRNTRTEDRTGEFGFTHCDLRPSNPFAFQSPYQLLRGARRIYSIRKAHSIP
jgi:hypothetical protein